MLPDESSSEIANRHLPRYPQGHKVGAVAVLKEFRFGRPDDKDAPGLERSTHAEAIHTVNSTAGAREW